MIEGIHIVYASDENFLMPTRVSIVSAFACSKHRELLEFDILDCGISDSIWQGFVEELRSLGLTRITRHLVDMKKFADMRAYHSSLGTYARFEIPQYLRNQEWCIYVDGDTLFLSDPFDLTTFFEGDNLILGHKDIGCDTTERHQWFSLNNYVWPGEDYVCAGFLVMNLKGLRAIDFTERCFEFMARHRDVPNNDQDVLNILCSRRIGFLPDGWGVFNIEPFPKSVPYGCIHYAFGKPWSLSHKWTHCLLDSDCLWLYAARMLCNVGLRELGLSHWNVLHYYLRSMVLRALLVIVSRTRAGRHRWRMQLGYFAPCWLKVRLKRQFKQFVRQ